MTHMAYIELFYEFLDQRTKFKDIKSIKHMTRFKYF